MPGAEVRIELALPRAFPRTHASGLRRAAEAAVAGVPRRVRASLLKGGVAYTLTVAVVGDARMRALNRRYRGKDKTTDVLSFSRLEGEAFPSPEAEVGDVLVSLAVAKRQAKEYGAPLAEELQRLVVHGVLHLFGYDHELGPKEARRHFGLQNRILRKLATAPPSRRR